MTCTIQLNHGFEAIVDPDDYEELSAYRWHVVRTKRGVHYAATNVKVGERYRCVKMHRMIMKPPPGMVTDHRDGNGLNNRKSNLRVCTQSENMRNRRAYGKSQYLGVHYNSERGKPWIASIGGKKLGRFDTEIEAAMAYDVAAIAAYGEFARPNLSNHSPHHMQAARKVMD